MLQTNRILQREQADLYAIERKLVQMMPKVQEALNSLKVSTIQHYDKTFINRYLIPGGGVTP